MQCDTSVCMCLCMYVRCDTSVCICGTSVHVCACRDVYRLCSPSHNNFHLSLVVKQQTELVYFLQKCKGYRESLGTIAKGLQQLQIVDNEERRKHIRALIKSHYAVFQLSEDEEDGSDFLVSTVAQTLDESAFMPLLTMGDKEMLRDVHQFVLGSNNRVDLHKVIDFGQFYFMQKDIGRIAQTIPELFDLSVDTSQSKKRLLVILKDPTLDPLKMVVMVTNKRQKV